MSTTQHRFKANSVIGQNILLKDMQTELNRGEGDQHIFVVNTSDKIKNGSASQRKGEISFMVTSLVSGKTSAVKIPNTWVPFDLSMQAQKLDIINSNEFLSLVSKSMIRILKTEDAINIIDEDEAAASEFERANSIINGGSNERSLIEQFEKKDVNTETFKSINPIVLETIEGDNGWDDNSKFSAIKNIESSLNKDDCEYILLKAKGNDKLKKLADNRLKTLGD